MSLSVVYARGNAGHRGCHVWILSTQTLDLLLTLGDADASFDQSHSLLHSLTHTLSHHTRCLGLLMEQCQTRQSFAIVTVQTKRGRAQHDSVRSKVRVRDQHYSVIWVFGRPRATRTQTGPRSPRTRTGGQGAVAGKEPWTAGKGSGGR